MTERRETGRPRRKPAGVKGKPGGKPAPGHKSPKHAALPLSLTGAKASASRNTSRGPASPPAAKSNA
jgi:hypothetical protein